MFNKKINFKLSNIKGKFFALVVFVSFLAIVFKLYDLQIVKVDMYRSDADIKSEKTIRLTGKRGSIMDADSVVLALSETTFNVTFQRSMKENRPLDYMHFTKSLLDTIRIIEKYGSSLSVNPIFERNQTTGEIVFNFGKGISENARNLREKRWRENHYMSAKSSKYDTAEKCFDALKKTYHLVKNDEIYNSPKFSSYQNVLDEINNLDEEMQLKILAVYTEMQMNLYNSLPITIAKDVPFTAVSEIMGRKMILNGIDISNGEKRIYPKGNLASQIIGYVGPISESDKYADNYKPLGYALNDTIGKDGIERSMENWLTPYISSRQGNRVMERDYLGRLTRQKSAQQPQDGNNIKLTIKYSFQKAAEQAIANNIAHTRKKQLEKIVDQNWLEKNREKLEKRDFDKYPLRLAETGSMVVLDVKTGNVLAMAQYPTFDLNAMSAGGKEATSYILDERKILQNHAIQSRYEPGSIFKMVTALAALTNGELSVDEKISDEGYYRKFTNNDKDAPVCWIAKNQRSKHANLTIIEGIKNSCNYFFYELSGRLYGDFDGTNRLYKYASRMGLTSKTGIQLPGELRSIVGNQASLYDPSSSLSKQETATPLLVAASMKRHLKNIGTSYGVNYPEQKLDQCITRLMQMAIDYPSGLWADNMRPILAEELNMTKEMVWSQVVIGDLWTYLNDIKWGGSMEVQMGIGQSITVLTPAAVSRYLASLANGGIVYNLNIVDSVVAPNGEILSKFEPNEFGRIEDAKPYFPYIREGMKGVVDPDRAGTASKRFKNWKYKNDIWAKTGTSQITIGGVKLDVENNSWFIALAPFNTPAEIAVVISIPNGLAGGESAEAAKEFIAWYMNNRAKESQDVPLVPGNELMP